MKPVGKLIIIGGGLAAATSTGEKDLKFQEEFLTPQLLREIMQMNTVL